MLFDAEIAFDTILTNKQEVVCYTAKEGDQSTQVGVLDLNT